MNVNFSEQVKTFENSTDDNQQEQQKFRHMKDRLLIEGCIHPVSRIEWAIFL